MSEAEFLEWQLGQDDRYELVDGAPRAMTGARFSHDRVVINTIVALRRLLREVGSPCEPATDDIAVRVPQGNLRRPDVALYCPPFDLEAMVSDRPRLVVEVLSETTHDTDHFVKLEEYKRVEALDYILLVAPQVTDALVWSRDVTRQWESIRYESTSDVVPLSTLGIALPMAELYDGVVLRPPRPKLVAEA
jgi:Uma2 family endonuclease